MIAFVTYISIHLQEGQQQGKQDIKTTQHVCYLVCSQDCADEIYPQQHLWCFLAT